MTLSLLKRVSLEAWSWDCAGGDVQGVPRLKRMIKGEPGAEVHQSEEKNHLRNIKHIEFMGCKVYLSLTALVSSPGTIFFC